MRSWIRQKSLITKIKGIMLIVLIVLSLIQTIILWLGYMPGLNSFNDKDISYMTPIHASNIWINKGDPFTVANKVDQSRLEFKRLTTELQQIIIECIDKEVQVELTDKTWSELLAMQGIFYEYSYSFNIDLSELAGGYDNSVSPVYFDNVFLHISDATGKKIDIYLIESRQEIIYHMEARGDYSNIVKLYNALNVVEDIEGRVKYQPSKKDNIGYYVRGNVFLPLFNELSPIDYDVITLELIMGDTEEEQIKTLESYVNVFFERPLLKRTEHRSDGSYIFTEPMKAIVRYHPRGTMEYINLDTSVSQKSVEMVEAYNIALDFIEENKSLSESVKEELYLKDFKQVGTKYMFYFDTKYNGYDIHLSEELKQPLGVSAFVEVTVSGDEVSSAKWLMHDIVASEKRQQISTPYSVPINLTYQRIKEENIDTLIQDVKLSYKVENITKDIELKWGVMYDNRWYYP